MERRSCLAATGDAKHAGQRVNMIPKLLIQRIAPAIVDLLSRTLREQLQLIWRRHRKLAQHERVHDTEDRCVGSNAQRKREYDHGGEQRRAQQLARGVAKVLGELFEPRPAPGVAGFFFEKSSVAEGAHGGVARLFAAHASGEILCDSVVEMKLEF